MKRIIWGIACCGAAAGSACAEAAPPHRGLFGAFVEQRPAAGDRPAGVVVMKSLRCPGRQGGH